MKTFLHLNNIYLNYYSFFFNYHLGLDGEIVLIGCMVKYDSRWCGLFLEDPDPWYRVIGSLGSLYNYHSLEDGPYLTVGGYKEYGERAKMMGIFHDDPDAVSFGSELLGSSAIILIMSILILN